MKGLSGKRYIVTGGGSGIGAATVQRLLSEGASVTAGDLNREGLERTQKESGNYEKLHIVPFDLGSESEIIGLVKAAVQRFGGLDGVANVAADVSTVTMGKDVEITGMDPELWTHVLKVNLIGTGIVLRESIPHMAAAGGGSAILISSAGAWLGEDVRPAYGASKIGLHATARHTARAWGKKGIRCNVIAPGMVLSETAAALMPKEYQDGMLSKMCAPRLGTPEDIAAAIAFLMSDDSRWITGQVWSVDGGLMMRE